MPIREGEEIEEDVVRVLIGDWRLERVTEPWMCRDGGVVGVAGEEVRGRVFIATLERVKMPVGEVLQLLGMR